MRIPGISKDPHEGHHELLFEEVDGKTVFKTHPGGNRKQRRSKQRHHPYYHKTRTGGRLWEIGVRDLLRDR